MIANLILAESARLWSRRMTRFFPLTLAALFVAGVGIAYAVIAANDTNVSFVADITGPDGSQALGPVASLLPVMAFVIGASFIGADIKTGMLEQIFTWEPRRLRVLGARAVVGTLTVGILAMALAVFLMVLLYLLAAITGTTDGTDAELWASVAGAVARTGLAAGLFCAFGIGVTVLVNSSVGSIVGFVIYWFIVESFLVSAFLPRVAVYLPITNAAAFAQGAPVQRIEGGVFSEAGPSFVDQHSYLVAGAILAAWTLLSLAVAAVALNRRDIA